jgi:hypothetical protein
MRLFSSMIERTPEEKSWDNWVFCIALEDADIEYIRHQYDWLMTNGSVVSAEFKMPNKGARFGECEDYFEMIDRPPDPLHGEEPLNYYRSMLDQGTPNAEYLASEDFSKPEQVRLYLEANCVAFKFLEHTLTICRWHESNGINPSDFFQPKK